jgi:hypothetical protein
VDKVAHLGAKLIRKATVFKLQLKLVNKQPNFKKQHEPANSCSPESSKSMVDHRYLFSVDGDFVSEQLFFAVPDCAAQRPEIIRCLWAFFTLRLAMDCVMIF